MSIPRAIVCIDGENLVFRFQAMLTSGRKAAADVIHVPDVYVWHPGILKEFGYLNVARVYLYTSMVGDDAAIRAMKDRIASVIFEYEYEDGRFGYAQIVPIVFKKPAKSMKSRQVDISITIDMMRFAHNSSIDLLYLLSGDGDFLPLTQEVMRYGKEVVVGALSSGLALELRHCVDEFVDLDSVFLKKPQSKKKAKGKLES